MLEVRRMASEAAFSVVSGDGPGERLSPFANPEAVTPDGRVICDGEDDGGQSGDEDEDEGEGEEKGFDAYDEEDGLGPRGAGGAAEEAERGRRPNGSNGGGGGGGGGGGAGRGHGRGGRGHGGGGGVRRGRGHTRTLSGSNVGRTGTLVQFESDLIDDGWRSKALFDYVVPAEVHVLTTH